MKCRSTLPYLQPPSGGCVLKLFILVTLVKHFGPAAFRRLCVETALYCPCFPIRRPAAFRRLCVETLQPYIKSDWRCPAAFRRLCVETSDSKTCWMGGSTQPPSGGCVLKLWSQNHASPKRQPAAFRRLCVETRRQLPSRRCLWTSRLQAAVC